MSHSLLYLISRSTRDLLSDDLYSIMISKQSMSALSQSFSPVSPRRDLLLSIHALSNIFFQVFSFLLSYCIISRLLPY
jgi:hypothetical protein